MASIFPRGEVWWIQICENGKKRQRSLRTKDKKVALYKKNEIENQLSRGDVPALGESVPASVAFAEYKTYRKNIITIKAQNADHPRIENYLKDECIARVRQITEASLKRHLDKRLEDDGISPRTANHTIRAVKTFAGFCIRRGYLHSHPLRFMKKYPIDISEPRFLPADQVHALIDAARGTNYFFPILTAVLTGMRAGELQRLRWSDIDLAANTITVAKSKSKKFRKIPIHPALKEEIEKNSGPGLCFPCMESYDSFDWHFHLIHKKAGIPGLRFHDLRHTFASLMIKSGADILTLSKILGHSSVVVTQMYAHLYQDHVQDAIKRLANLLTV